MSGIHFGQFRWRHLIERFSQQSIKGKPTYDAGRCLHLCSLCLDLAAHVSDERLALQIFVNGAANGGGNGHHLLLLNQSQHGESKSIRPTVFVWYEAHPDRESAAASERQLKNWSHTKKQKLATRAIPFNFGQPIRLSLLSNN